MRVEKSLEKIKRQLDWQERKRNSYKWELVRYKTPGNDEFETLI